MTPVSSRTLGMRPLQELVEPTQLADDVERGRMHGVAAKVPQKVGVLFEHDHVDAGAGEQDAEHHAGRPAAGDATAGLDRRRHADCGVMIAGSMYGPGSPPPPGGAYSARKRRTVRIPSMSRLPSWQKPPLCRNAAS
jgi:hypothetical protein